jgi:hypothetical protein
MWQNSGGDKPSKNEQPRRDAYRYAGRNPSPGKETRRDGKQKPQDGKETRKFLDTHPATIPQQKALAKSVDRGMFELAGQSAMPAGTAQSGTLSQQILVYHESEPAAAGNDWMYKLKEESMQFLADQKGVQLQKLYRETVYKKGIETLIDKIYGLLQRYTFEFNQIAAGTDLHVSGTISGDVTEVTRFNKLREAEETETYFRARISTRVYSLVMRGKNECVEFYLLPVNKVMALSKMENEYRPLSRIQVRITEEGMMWRMENGVPNVDSLDELCMWLFSNLVNETKQVTARRDAEAQGEQPQ